MKKITRVFAIILAASMLFCAIPFAVSAESHLSGKTVVCFGDSLTQGTLWWNNNGHSVYPDYLAQRFPEATIVNAGSRGDSTYNASLRFEEDVLAKNPDIVIICFGMNDQAWEVKYDRPIIPPENYRKNLEGFVSALKAIEASVVFVTPNPVNGDSYTANENNDYNYGLMADYCNEMRAIALENGCALIDINREIELSGDLSKYIASDGIHQTVAGHELYARLIGDYLAGLGDESGIAGYTVNCFDEQGRKILSYMGSGLENGNTVVAPPRIEGFTLAADQAPVNGSFSGGSFGFNYVSELSVAMEKARKITVRDFGESLLAELKAACEKGEALLNTATADAAAMAGAAKEINEILALGGISEKIVSVGAKYEAPASERTDSYKDSGTRLTDGVKGAANAGTAEYAGWGLKSMEIILDLGSEAETDIYRVYAAGGAWGVPPLGSMKVSYSNDKESFTAINGAAEKVLVASHTDTASPWKVYTFTVKTEAVQKARYIKFTMSAEWGSHIWLGEIEAARSAELIADRVDVYSFNKKVEAGDSVIFTADFGQLNDNTANLRYTQNIVAKLQGENYIITEVYSNNGQSEARTLKADEILIAVHGDPSVENSEANKALAATAKVGEMLVIESLSVADKTVEIGGNIAFAPAPQPEYMQGDVNGNGKIDANDYALIKRAVLKTYTLTEAQKLPADVNKNGKIDAADYGMVKRHVLKTYDIFK